VSSTPATTVPNSATTGRPALREGLLFGLALGVLSLIVHLIAAFAHTSLLESIYGFIEFVLMLVVAIIAGIRASAKTGKVSSGLLAGFLAALISTLLSSIGTLIFDLENLSSLVQAADQQAKALGSPVTYTNNLIISGAIASVVIYTLLFAAIGLGMGAIGGAIGRGRAPKPQTPYQESMYPGGGYPGAYPPPMPPGAGYPPQQPPAYPGSYPQQPPSYPQG